MIRIDRSSVVAPEVLRRSHGSKADREFQKAKAFYNAHEQNRQRGPFDFKVFRDAAVKRALNQLFRKKCAFCETPLSASVDGDIMHYRPKGGVISEGRKLLATHYWWLANEWTNLYLSCPHCNRVTYRGPKDSRRASGKGGQFPLADEATRAKPLAGADELEAETPLLLDPCRDAVENFLSFSSDGKVSSSHFRGQATITLLGLNRPGLVEARRSTANLVAMLMQAALNAITLKNLDQVESAVRQLKEMTAPHAAYAGMCRDLIQKSTASLPEREAVYLRGSMEFATESLKDFSPAEELAAKEALVDFERKRSSYSLEDDTTPAINTYLQLGSPQIERISIRNLGAISKLDLNLVDGGEQARWLMLLGENAAGKSTVLQAVALALLGDRYRQTIVNDLHLDIGAMVKAGANQAEVRLDLSGALDPRVLIINRAGSIEADGPEAQLLLAAYGSTRLLPRQPGKPPTGASYARVENLFDPFTSLIDARHWLLKASPEEFDYAGVAIKTALAINLDRKLVRQKDDVGLVEFGKFVPLNRLCDGYQTVIALIVDILSLVLPTWKTPELAQGLILIDEVGNHLHPSWKLRFVESIRSVFPGMQLITTTHDPLCLRGLRRGEIAVLHKTPRGSVNLVAGLPSIEGMRVDQILTSEHFGLASTLDPALQDRFDRYNFLLRKPNPTHREKAEIIRLRDQINRGQQLGNTERERRLLATIDRFLAVRPEIENVAEQTESDDGFEAELKAIWVEATNRRGPRK